jgi:hypothetical protein
VSPRAFFGVSFLKSEDLRVTSHIRSAGTEQSAPNERYTGLVLSTATGEPLAIFPDGMVQPMRQMRSNLYNL